MEAAEILSYAPRVLTQEQRESYFERGYVVAESVIPPDWIARLKEAVGALVESSRSLTEPDAVYDLETGHSAASPRLRRITNPATLHPEIWEYASKSLLGDIVADLVGPNVKYLDTMINFKWRGGGAEIKWHQDMPFYPHTNYSLLTIGTFLEDVGPAQAPMAVIPGSHDGPLYDHYGPDGRWAGHIADGDVQAIATDTAVHLMGPAGTIQVHNARTVHGSARNNSDRGRPILLATYGSADAFCYVPYPAPGPYTFSVVRGEPARVAHHDPRPCPIPPDWSKGKGYQSIFTWQKQEAAPTEGRPLGT